MTIQKILVGGWNGGGGRTLTAALLAYGLHCLGRRPVLVRQIPDGSPSSFDPIGATLPLPCRELALCDRYALPPGLSLEIAALVDAADERFVHALQDLAQEELGHDGIMVIDLCGDHRALNLAIVAQASIVLVPARQSIFACDWAARGVAQLYDIQRELRHPVPIVTAAIGSGSNSNQHRERLSALAGDHASGQPSTAIVDVPFLDEATLIRLWAQQQIWEEPELAARCQIFAASVLEYVGEAREPVSP